MRTLIIAALLFSVACAYLTEDEQFSVWMSEHGKVYTPEEYPVRLQNFKNTLAKIKKLNDESPIGGAEYGINKFSDMSDQEFRETVLMKPQDSVDMYASHDFTAAPGAPSTFDWRDQKVVTAVKDQGQCGSCWAFSATEAIESSWIRAGKATNSINLSPQQIVDCDKADGGCGGGWPDSAMNYVKGAGGQEGISHYAYTARNGACAFNKQYVEATVAGYKTATSARDETTMQNNLLAWGPLSICLDASQWNSYRGGVMTPAQCCQGTCQLDHCVQLVGYNATANPGYWIVRNSWGTGWGNGGYIYLQMGGNTCALTNHATWPTV